MSIGWIKLHRKIQDCSLWDSEEPFDRRSAWVDLLLLANHEDKEIIFKGQPLTIKAGQRVTSIRKLSARWNWSVNRTKRFLDLLENLGMIVRDSDNNRTLLTLIKYSEYQGRWYTDEHTDGNTDGHSDEYTDGHQTRMNKNDKNENKYIYAKSHRVKNDLSTQQYDFDDMERKLLSKKRRTEWEF